jgi:hypothetical protein
MQFERGQRVRTLADVELTSNRDFHKMNDPYQGTVWIDLISGDELPLKLVDQAGAIETVFPVSGSASLYLNNGQFVVVPLVFLVALGAPPSPCNCGKEKFGFFAHAKYCPGYKHPFEDVKPWELTKRSKSLRQP